MSILDTLITNRVLGAKYNCSDLNRVFAALRYIAKWLVALGRSCPIVDQTNRTFTRTMIPTVALFQLLSECMQTAIDALGDEMPPHRRLPKFGSQGNGKDYLTHSDANALEQILAAMHIGCLTLEGWRSYLLEQQGEDLYQYYNCAVEPTISYELEDGCIYAVYSGGVPELELDADGSIYLKTLEGS